LGQDKSIGHLQVGGVADVVVFDLEDPWQVTSEGLHSQGKHTPFGFARSGMALPGRVKATWVNGHLAFAA
jgi:dihydroorotase